ncbi:MAG: hypothetical protein JXA82_03010 [Sedimentisphaerales bacterium]|nr:hypothetical protein [Sedimentisphaerales bacterium]
MKRTLLIVVMALLVGSVYAAPTIINTDPLTGPVTTRADIVWNGDLASAVGSLAMGSAEEDSVQVFAENLNVILAQDLALVGGGVISAGTAVNSYIVHFDPIGRSSTPVWEGKGSILFDEQVLGLIYSDGSSAGDSLLTSSDDIVGLGSNFYESNTYHRKFEVGGNKWIDIASSGTGVDLNLFTNSSMDEVRIITQAVPAPGALFLGVVGTSLVGYLRRRKTV